MAVIDINEHIKGDLILEAYIGDIQIIVEDLEANNTRLRIELAKVKSILNEATDQMLAAGLIYEEDGQIFDS